MTTDSPASHRQGNCCAACNEAGFAALSVGGCVRDFLLGREPQDFDVATDAKPDQVEKLFHARPFPSAKNSASSSCVEKGQQFQVATFRAEADYLRRPAPEKIDFRQRRGRCLASRFHVERIVL